MSTSKRFLETIQPVDGWKCGEIFEPGKKKPRRIWARTSEELGVMLENADAHGSTVYHAVSSYRERSTRKRENVLAIKSFWLDLDAGPGKPYVDMGQAVNALATFLHATRLPEPVLVGSGVGVHVYWPLQRQLTLAEWQPLANNLKDLCRKHGLQAGPERTGDAASILRPPGTHHRKDPNNVRPVIGGDPRGPYDLADLAALHNSQPVLGGGGVAYPVSRPGAPTGLTADLLNVHLDDPADADLVADQCQQMRAMRETRGDRLPEPLWYAGIGVLAFCADGEALAHAEGVGAVFLGRRSEEPDPVERGVDPRAGCGGVGESVGRIEPSEVCAASEIGVEGRSLHECTDPWEGEVRLRRYAVSEDFALASRGRDEAEQHTDGRGLARAIRAEEAIDRARGDFEVERVDNGALAEAFGQAVRADRK